MATSRPELELQVQWRQLAEGVAQQLRNQRSLDELAAELDHQHEHLKLYGELPEDFWDDVGDDYDSLMPRMSGDALDKLVKRAIAIIKAQGKK